MANPWPPHWNDPAVRWDAGWTWPGAISESVKHKQTNRKQTMRRQRWYPSRIADQIPWHENFRTKLPGYVVTLGMDLAKADAAVATSRYVIYVLSQWLAAARTFGQSSTQAIDLLLQGSGVDAVVLPVFTAPALPAAVSAVPPGALTRLFELVREMKESDAYTKTIGQDLGIIGSEDAADHPSPTLKLTVDAGTVCQCVDIVFVKFGHMGVYLESRRNGGAWEFLAIYTESPYMDERPLLVAGVPEIREYRARFWDKGTPNGEWTDVARTTVSL
jgi:hypothetical protein